MTLNHLMQTVRHAAANGIGTLSTGEALAAALVLNRPDWLAAMNYSIGEALNRIDDNTPALIPVAEKQWHDEVAANAHVQAIAAHANQVASLLGSPNDCETDSDPVYLDAHLVTVGSSPGYRTPNLQFSVRVIDSTRSDKRHSINITLRPQDGEDIVRHILNVHRFTWQPGSRPIDAAEGEQRPLWIDDVRTRY